MTIKDRHEGWENRRRRKEDEVAHDVLNISIIMDRESDFRDFIMSSWPDDIDAKLFFSSYATWEVSAYIELDDGAEISDTHRAVAWATRQGFKMERNFNSNNGTFYWSGERRVNVSTEHEHTQELHLNNTHDFGCKLIKEEYTATRYRSECPEGVPAQAEEIEGEF